MEHRAHTGSIAAHPPPSGRLALWWQATRPATVLTSLIPGLAGGLVAIGSPHPRWWLLAVALIALALLHAGTNASNDVEDFANGVDPPDKRRGSGVFTSGRLSVREGRWLYGGLFAGAFALGLLICALQGPALIVIGVVGLLGGLLYTAGPAPYKYVGLGDPAIVLLMGPLMTQGVYTAVTGDAFHAAAFWVGLTPGLLIECVLAANNLTDLDTDRAAGIRTLAVRIGLRRAQRLFLITVAAALPVVLVLWLAGLFDAWILLPLVTAPRFVALARQVRAATEPGDPRMQTLLPNAAVLHLSFCALLCAGVVLSRA